MLLRSAEAALLSSGEAGSPFDWELEGVSWSAIDGSVTLAAYEAVAHH
jgi:hypothetical protein